VRRRRREDRSGGGSSSRREDEVDRLAEKGPNRRHPLRSRGDRTVSRGRETDKRPNGTNASSMLVVRERAIIRRIGTSSLIPEHAASVVSWHRRSQRHGNAKRSVAHRVVHCRMLVHEVGNEARFESDEEGQSSRFRRARQQHASIVRSLLQLNPRTGGRTSRCDRTETLVESELFVRAIELI